MKAIIVIFLGLTSVFVHACQSKAQNVQSSKLIIEATVEKIGKPPGGDSGLMAVYQVAKYKVTSVCNGDYDKKEIMVDHLIRLANDLEGLRPGDRVRLVLEKSPKIFVRNNEEGFRDASENVSTFYIGEKPKVLSSNCAACEPCS